jgi:hypothetical protein
MWVDNFFGGIAGLFVREKDWSWRFVLIFCFFFIKEKEKGRMPMCFIKPYHLPIKTNQLQSRPLFLIKTANICRKMA